MQKVSNEIEIIRQLFGSLSEKDKKTFLKSIKFQDEPSKKETINRKITHCPHCNSAEFSKNGKVSGFQRFICKECGKTFGTRNQTIFYAVKKDMGIWKQYIHCMIEKYSLRKTAEICGISTRTAFVWRHKILDALQKMQDEVKLDGAVEADETFLPLSFKGHHKDFNLPRLAKHRGKSATRRGLSREQVCVACGVNSGGLSVSKVANLGKPNIHSLNKVLGGKIARDSVFVTDSFRAYSKLSYEMGLNHIRIPRNKYKLGSFNIQTINSYHSRLKSMLIHDFKGVSTEYLNNYLVYNNFVNFAKEVKSEKEQILLDHIINTKCLSKSINIADRLSILLLQAS
ncbi:IS1595 family transposase, partial [Helicobacter acinonychis]|uniref:IS1595 family transposase n=1 Tax=Helicobacter acinonychis TaxID=212 RepID=UPI000CF1C215